MLDSVALLADDDVRVAVFLLLVAAVTRVESEAGVSAALTQAAKELTAPASDFHDHAPAQTVAFKEHAYQRIVVFPEAGRTTQRGFVAGPVLDRARIELAVENVAAVAAQTKRDRGGRRAERSAPARAKMACGNRYSVDPQQRSNPRPPAHDASPAIHQVQITSGVNPNLASSARISSR